MSAVTEGLMRDLLREVIEIRRELGELRREARDISRCSGCGRLLIDCRCPSLLRGPVTFGMTAAQEARVALDQAGTTGG